VCVEDRQNGVVLGQDVTTSLTPAPIAGLTGVTSISSGFGSLCAVLSDRTVRCVGANNFGQLGDGTLTDSLTPVKARGLTDVVSLQAGRGTCAIRADKSVSCWGLNEFVVPAASGPALWTKPTVVPALQGSVSISNGFRHTCAIAADSSVRCWGVNDFAQVGTGSEFPATIYTPSIVQ
jgi:alpha-tubulin suppressor-like RCC1 family protein